MENSIINNLTDTLNHSILQENANANVGKSERIVSVGAGAFIALKGITNVFSHPLIALTELGLKDKPENWDKYTVINMIHLLKPDSLKLIIDCGTEDFFYQVNNNFHQKLLENKIPHDYIVRAGAHNWAYWKNAVAYQLFFMHRYFNKL